MEIPKTPKKNPSFFSRSSQAVFGVVYFFLGGGVTVTVDGLLCGVDPVFFGGLGRGRYFVIHFVKALGGLFCLQQRFFVVHLWSLTWFTCKWTPLEKGGEPVNRIVGSYYSITHLKFNSSPLKSYHPKRKGLSSNIFQPSFFRGKLLNFGGVFSEIRPALKLLGWRCLPLNFKRWTTVGLEKIREKLPGPSSLVALNPPFLRSNSPWNFWWRRYPK